MRAIRYFLLIYILLITSNTYGQDFLFDKKSKNSIQLGLFYSFDTNLSSDIIEIDQYSGYNVNNNQSFNAGLNLQYYILRNFAFYSGMSYSTREFEGKYYCENCLLVDNPHLQKFNLQFLQIPTTVRYYPYQNNIGVFGELGFLNQIKLGNSKNNTLERNAYSLSAVLGAGTKYNIGYGLTVQLAAKYTHNLSEIFKEAEYSYKVLGIQLSVLKQL